MESFADHYQSLGYAAFEGDHRRGGTFGLSLSDVKQGAIEAVDPALPKVLLVTLLNRHDPVECDFGDGWKMRGFAEGVVDVQPAFQGCAFRLPDLHLRIAFAPVGSLRALLEERGLGLSAPSRANFAPRRSPPQRCRHMAARAA